MLKVLIIGAAGNMGKNHVRVAKKYLVSIEHKMATCDIADGTGIDYTNWKQAIKDFKPTHIIIATPTQFHEEMLDYCLELQNITGIFVEKPIIDGPNPSKYGTTPENNLMVGHIERYNPMVLQLQKLLEGKDIDTIICTRSGLAGTGEDYNLHIDLCVHDSDVCQLLTRYKPTKKNICLSKSISANSCNLFVNINGVDCFLHADKKSPFKRREIKIMGPGYIIEGDYINQKVWLNGDEINITKTEPLLVELTAFFEKKYSVQDLLEAIENVRLVKGM